MKLLRSPISRLVFLTVLFAIATAVYHVRVHYLTDPEYVTSRVTSVTQQRYEDLIARSDAMKQMLQEGMEPDVSTYQPIRLNGSDITLFVFKEGKVIFWSDNTVSPENLADNLRATPERFVRLSNGWYQCYTDTIAPYTILGLSLVKRSYPYDNEYLINHFQSDFRLINVPVITDEKGEYPVTDEEGNALFFLRFHDGYTATVHAGNFGYLLFIISFLLLNLLLLQLHRRLNPFPSLPGVALIAFILDAVLVRWLIFHFQLPEIVHQGYLFNPQLYASSAMNRSLGDLLFNSVTILIIAYALFRYADFKPLKDRPIFKLIATGGLFLGIAGLILLFTSVVRSLIFDSTLSFNFQNLLSVDRYSFLGLLVMLMAAMSLLMLNHRIFILIRQYLSSWLTTGLLIAPAFLMLLGLALIGHNQSAWIALMIFTGFSLVYLVPPEKGRNMFNRAILLMIVVTIGLTWLINHYNSEKERNLRMVVAANYAQKDDPMAEFLFSNARDAIYKDTTLAALLFDEKMDEDLIISYILQKYFAGGEKYWGKYNFQVTICTPVQQLQIDQGAQLVDCYQFFDAQVKELGTTTISPDFIFMNDPMGQSSYLGILRFVNVMADSTAETRVFIEIFPKIVPVEVGYLELLVDQSIKQEAVLNKYANARYYRGQLVASFGKYIYSIDLQTYGKDSLDQFFFSKGGYSHLYYRTGANTVLLISSPEKGILDSLAPFSLFLLVFIILFALGWQIKNRMEHYRVFRTNFKHRLQLMLLSVIVVSFVVIGLTSVYYISVLNRDKNMANLKDKARSIRIEIEHKLANKAILDEEIKPYLETLLIKFNDVFATDINLFDMEGNLLASSRKKIFLEGLIGNRMNTEAYQEMVLHKKTLLIHEEQIGRLNYLSAYIPFKNNRGDIIAYINLPYFARQSELSDEISSFLMAFINIYLLLIGITIIVAFLISDRISKPLLLIRERIQHVKLGSANEKIQWEGYDEIGDLVNEYNRMIDELEKSAVLLARSERESAWREMAKQVAHEIKNPLTPMKLSLQQLQKTMPGGEERWQQQFGKYSAMMHQQIESLSNIATAFSDFANMPGGQHRTIHLETIVNQAITLFKGYEEVHFEVQVQSPDATTVQGDHEQLTRMVINLISNAVQARMPDRGLEIVIRLKSDSRFRVLEIQDNGKGIAEEIREQIFMPNFTTKTSGMGMGLAISRNIIESMGGSVTFVSEKGRGTIFTVTIPIQQG